MTILHSDLLKALSYDHETGIFTWVKTPPNIRPGAKVGGPDSHGYWRIGVGGKRYWAHRLAWFYVHASWPADEIDHIDGNPLNNRISNLRQAKRGQNAANGRTRKDNRSQLKGATWHFKTNKWIARIQKDGKRISLGYFDTPEGAHHAYTEAAGRIHGEFARAA